MLRCLGLTIGLALAGCAAPDATVAVDALTQIEKHYDERAASADALVASADGISAVARAEWKARAAHLDEQTRELFDKLRDWSSEWGKVDWRAVAKDSIGLIREARGR